MLFPLLLSILIGVSITIIISFALQKLQKKRVWHLVFSLFTAGLLFFSPSFIDYDGSYGLYYMVAAFSSVFIAFIAMLLETIKVFSISNVAISVLLFVLLLSSCLLKYVLDKSIYESTYLTLVSPIAIGMIVNLFYGHILTD